MENPGVPRVLYLNSDTGIFSDLKVRQAFQSAIDRTTAVKAAFFGILKPADNILGPATLDYDPAIASQWGLICKKPAVFWMKPAGSKPIAKATGSRRVNALLCNLPILQTMSKPLT